MKNYRKELERQLTELNYLAAQISSRRKMYRGLEPGTLRMAKSHGIPQYQFVREGSTKPEYIPMVEKNKAILLAQRDYDEKMSELLTTMQSRLKRFLKNYNPDSINEFYEKLCPGRKQLVTPILPTKEMLIQSWMEKHPGSLNTYEEKPDIKTDRGDLVRSKSEKIIADYLYKKGIPYQVEPAFRLYSGTIKYPDFVALNLRTGKTIYWEHLGKADDDDYATRNFAKLMDYEKSGLILGDNLIVTLETKDSQLDIGLVEKKVQQFLL